MMTVHLEPEVVEEIGRIGFERSPNEACGFAIPVPHKGKLVFEMPNRSHRPRDSFEMRGDDIAITLSDYEGPIIGFFIWHTHPGGYLGPSPADMKHRHDRVPNLVVTLTEDNTAKATWY